MDALRPPLVGAGWGQAQPARFYRSKAIRNWRSNIDQVSKFNDSVRTELSACVTPGALALPLVLALGWRWVQAPALSARLGLMRVPLAAGDIF